MPPDTEMVSISRTIGSERLVDEILFCFTHTVEMDWMLPGIGPTGKRGVRPFSLSLGVRNHIREGSISPKTSSARLSSRLTRSARSASSGDSVSLRDFLCLRVRGEMTSSRPLKTSDQHHAGVEPDQGKGRFLSSPPCQAWRAVTRQEGLQCGYE